jgi:transposase
MLSRAQLAKMKPYFPVPHGVRRVDDRRVLSGITYVIRNGLQWKDAPKAYGPHKTEVRPILSLLAIADWLSPFFASFLISGAFLAAVTGRTPVQRPSGNGILKLPEAAPGDGFAAAEPLLRFRFRFFFTFLARLRCLGRLWFGRHFGSCRFAQGFDIDKVLVSTRGELGGDEVIAGDEVCRQSGCVIDHLG